MQDGYGRTIRTTNTYYELVSGEECVYCGDPADVLDHAYPASRPLDEAPKGMLLIVPACHECNYQARAAVHKTMADRRKFIQKALRRKHRSLLATPKWSDAELGRLKGRLREAVMNALEAQRRLLLRVNYKPEDDDVSY